MSGIIEQYRNEGSGELHRIGGPAIAYSNGLNLWYCHGKRHRRGGPAVVWSEGSGAEEGDKFWYINYRRLRAPEQLPERAHGIMELFL